MVRHWERGSDRGSDEAEGTPSGEWISGSVCPGRELSSIVAQLASNSGAGSAGTASMARIQGLPVVCNVAGLIPRQPLL